MPHFLYAQLTMHMLATSQQPTKHGVCTELRLASPVAYSLPPLSLTMICIICCSRRLQPTPPTMSTSFLPVCAIARSVISTNIANMVSCQSRNTTAKAVPQISKSPNTKAKAVPQISTNITSMISSPSSQGILILIWSPIGDETPSSRQNLYQYCKYALC